MGARRLERVPDAPGCHGGRPRCAGALRGRRGGSAGGHGGGRSGRAAGCSGGASGRGGHKLELFRVLNGPGLSAADNESIGNPPDPTGSVSPLHYVEVVNARIAVYERERLRRPVADMDATAFWGAEARASWSTRRSPGTIAPAAGTT